jgi:hypothetical protein
VAKVAKGVEGDSGKQAVERRKRYEGEEAWENRGMAQVPFYNSGNVWRRSQESLIHKSLRSQCSKLDQSLFFLLGFVQDLVISRGVLALWVTTNALIFLVCYCRSERLNALGHL